MWFARALRSALLAACFGLTLASRSILLVSRAEVEFVNLGTIPNDGKVIDDIRDFGD